MSERDAIADYLERRAAFWAQWSHHEGIARALRNEALTIRTDWPK